MNCSESKQALFGQKAVGYKEECGSKSDNWWLRSPGDNTGNAAVVNTDGNVNANGNPVNNTYAVRPDLPHRSKRASRLVPSMPGQRYRIPIPYSSWVRDEYRYLEMPDALGFRCCLRVSKQRCIHPQPMALDIE